MTLDLVSVNAVLAVFVFAGAASQLACHPAAKATFKAQVFWLAWLWCHVGIGVGAFAVMMAPFVHTLPTLAGTTLILFGMAVYFGLRWLERTEGHAP